MKITAAERGAPVVNCFGSMFTLNARCPPRGVQLQHTGAPDLDHLASAAIKPIVQGEPAFFERRRVPISAPSTARSFHAFIRDIVPVASLIRSPSVLEVNPSVPAKTVPEFIAYAKAYPGKLTMASSGIETPSHVFGELFKFMTGVNLVHVPYRGAAPAVTDLLAGQVQVFFDPMPNSMGYIRAGKLRPLAITTATRSEALPDVPTVSEFVPGYEASFWFGVGAPKATPADIVDKLNKEVNAALDDPKMKARLADLGGTVLLGSPADFGKHIAEETEKWAKVIRAANIKPE